jgi:predicted transcriptional regulator
MSETTPMSAIDQMIGETIKGYLANNQVAVDQIPAVVKSLSDSIRNAVQGLGPAPTEPSAPQKPAVPIRSSVQPDHIVCLENGQKFQSLKRHLRTAFGMSPEQYRAKWNLPADYPMVAPNYARTRSELAKASGLGMGRKANAASNPKSAAEAA